MPQKISASLFIEIFGWYGALAILLAYALVSFSIIEASGLWAQLLNFTGALGIITVATYKKVWQSVTLNIIWGLVALVALIRIFI